MCVWGCTCIYTHIHTSVYTGTYTYTHVYTCTHGVGVYVYTHIYSDTDTRIHTYTHMRANTQRHIHTHMHSRTHTSVPPPFVEGTNLSQLRNVVALTAGRSPCLTQSQSVCGEQLARLHALLSPKAWSPSACRGSRTGTRGVHRPLGPCVGSAGQPEKSAQEGLPVQTLTRAHACLVGTVCP